MLANLIVLEISRVAGELLHHLRQSRTALHPVTIGIIYSKNKVTIFRNFLYCIFFFFFFLFLYWCSLPTLFFLFLVYTFYDRYHALCNPPSIYAEHTVRCVMETSVSIYSLNFSLKLYVWTIFIGAQWKTLVGHSSILDLDNEYTNQKSTTPV